MPDPRLSTLRSTDRAAGLRLVNSDWLRTNLPCRAACPVGTHAGGYVSLVAEGRDEDAYALARRSNPFASVCGRVCSHPCEAVCRRKDVDAPIAIRALKRFVTERRGLESGRSYPEILEVVERPRPRAENAGRVAIVGAGPAGLACGHDLALMGHRVVVLEASKQPGGLMRLGIPEYRLPRALLDHEIGFIEHLGVEIRLGVEVGRDVTFTELTSEYDAVFLAPGCRKSRSVDIPGTELEGVFSAIDVLRAVNLGHDIDIGENVVVVGGGGVAFDAARTLRLLHGASLAEDHGVQHQLVDAAKVVAKALKRKVSVVALESFDEMPAEVEELEEGAKEGLRVLHRVGPKALLGEGGRVRALQVLSVKRVYDAQGRFAPELHPNTEREIACDTVILAVGQTADLGFLGARHGLAVSPGETLVVDARTLATSEPGVYAGGDAAFGPRSLIEAIADGRRAARSMDTYLTGRTDEPPVVRLRRFDTFGYDHPFATGDYDQIDRSIVPLLEVEQRHTKVQVELGFDDRQARIEGSRCLHCWINTVFDSRRMSGSECIQCAGCVDICPMDCIDLVSLTRVDPSTAPPLRLPDGAPLTALGHSGAALLKDETACIRCGLCARRCPVSCITMQGFYLDDEMDMLAPCETRL